MAPTGFVGQEPPRGKTGIMFRKNKPYFVRLREKFEVQEDKKVPDGQASSKRSPKISSSRRGQNSASVKSHHSGEHARRKTDNGDKPAARKQPTPSKLTSEKHKSLSCESPSLVGKPTQDRSSLVDECDNSTVANWIKAVQANADQQREQVRSKTGTALPVRLEVPRSKKPSPSSPRPAPRDQTQASQNLASRAQKSRRHGTEQKMSPPPIFELSATSSTRMSPARPRKSSVSTPPAAKRSACPPSTSVGTYSGTSSLESPRSLQALPSGSDSWAYPDTSSITSTRGSSTVPPSRTSTNKKVRISAIADIYGDGISNKESSETSSASFGLTFPVFDERTWDLLRERDPSLPHFKKVECFGDAGDRDTDLWLGLANPVVVKLSSKALIAHVTAFWEIFDEGSQFCLGRGGFATPRYAVSISANENLELVLEPAERVRNLDQSTVDHTRNMKYYFMDFIRALHGQNAKNVPNIRHALKRIANHLRCPAAIRQCLETVEDKQYSELKKAVWAEAREYLHFSHKYGAEKVFRMTFHDVVMQAAGSENFERYLRGIPSAVRFIVKMEMERWRMGLVFDNLWERAWAALEGEPQVPSDTS